MEPELESFYKQLSDAVLESVGDTIKTVVGDLSSRQDKFEETSRTRLNELNKQISSLLHSIYQFNASEENFFHTSQATCSESHSLSSNSMDGIYSCKECKNVYSTTAELDIHTRVAHK